jgi:ABC-type cobalamin/Fe3+-siderophores transport system ATPase subunit
MNPSPSILAPFRELAAEALHFGYDRTPVIDGVSFRARPGELLAIVGPNGCGKSTLLKLLMGALQPAAGRVTIDDKSIVEYGRIGLARRMALVPQMGGPDALGAMSAGLGGGFTVLQTVLQARYAAHVDDAREGGLLKAAGGLGIFGFETPADHQKARQAMWSQDVHHLLERDLESLSGGERQRVAIARALAQETPVLLLDEPTSALDLYHQLELAAHLAALTRPPQSPGTAERPRLVVLVTHDLNLALACATRVLVMDRGRIVADGPPADVLTPAVLENVYQVRVRREGGGLRFERLPSDDTPLTPA